MATGFSGPAAATVGESILKGSGGLARSSRQPAQGQLSRKWDQEWTLRCPSLQEMVSLSSPTVFKERGLIVSAELLTVGHHRDIVPVPGHYKRSVPFRARSEPAECTGRLA